MIRTILVGAGRVAQHYLKIFSQYPNELSDFQISEIVDSNKDKADLLASAFGAVSSIDLEKSLRKAKFDLAIILTPSFLHFKHALTALNSGSHVLVEKPSTLLMGDSQLLGSLANSKNLKLGTVVQNRLNTATKFAKNAIDQNWFGKIQNVAVRLIWSRSIDYYKDEWHGRWLTDGGVLSQQGFHHLDIARYLCGEVSHVYSEGAALRHRIAVDDTSVGVIKFENGALGTLELTTTAPKQDIEASIKITGSEGYIEIGGVGLNRVLNLYSERLSNLEIIQYQREYSEEFENGYGLSHHRILQLFGSDISNSTNKYFPWDDTTKTLQLIHTLYASQEQGIPLRISSMVKSQRLGVDF